MGLFKCRVCHEKFLSKILLNQHLNSQHNVAGTSSSSSSTQTRTMKRNVENKQNSIECKRLKKQDDDNMIKCVSCNIDIAKDLMHGHKRTNEHKNKCSVVYKENNIEVIQIAFKSRINTFRVKNVQSDELSIQNFLTNITESVFMLINEHLQTHTSIKVNVELFGGYMIEKNDKLEYDIKSFNTKNEIITISTNLSKTYDMWKDVIKTKSEEFSERESGWHLVEILYLEVNINKFNPLRGSSYVKLPKNIENKKAVVNVKNYDNECFGHAIISALKPVESNSDLITSYPNFRSVLDFSGIEFPIKFTDIHKFEEQNNISVNVFGLNSKKDNIMGPLHHTKQRRFTHINLLYIEEKGISHFCWIKNLSRLVSKQLNLKKCRKHICDGCLQYFTKDSLLREHQKDDCGKIRTILPYGGNNFFLVV